MRKRISIIFLKTQSFSPFPLKLGSARVALLKIAYWDWEAILSRSSIGIENGNGFRANGKVNVLTVQTSIIAILQKIYMALLPFGQMCALVCLTLRNLF